MVQARAPGKVIWSGEYAVVHGSAAVAAALWTLSWDASKGTVAAVMTFLFLYTSILSSLQPIAVRLTSELTVGVGLGSSAAHCVCLAAALLHLAAAIDLPTAGTILHEEKGSQKFPDTDSGVDLDEAKSWQLPDECLPTGDITTVLRAKEEAKFEKLVDEPGLIAVSWSQPCFYCSCSPDHCCI
ncbi:unnamed protein product [Sphagnum jensenii]|uniref:GHMP kinase N-terminal domain-containing protein n=1 Tax=Sphagnum jensenii TaxID=128206 RepID=A0ABP0W5X9_9BRYO